MVMVSKGTLAKWHPSSIKELHQFSDKIPMQDEAVASNGNNSKWDLIQFILIKLYKLTKYSTRNKYQVLLLKYLSSSFSTGSIYTRNTHQFVRGDDNYHSLVQKVHFRLHVCHLASKSIINECIYNIDINKPEH